ncbi:MAG: hypothetical protein SNJ66_09815 [Chloroherpetonaceae bacterium]
MVDKKTFLRLPVVSLSAEYLVMGHLMRRNILTYKAPPNNEGYDLICIHPDPKKVTKQIRVQVKSRYQTDCDRGFPVKEKSIDSFDYLVVAFLNIGYFFSKHKKGQHSSVGKQEPEFYTLPADIIRQYHKKEGGWEKVRTREFDITPYKNELGFELIANDLQIPLPTK